MSWVYLLLFQTKLAMPHLPDLLYMSFSVALTILQVLSSHMCLVTNVLSSAAVSMPLS